MVRGNKDRSDGSLRRGVEPVGAVLSKRSVPFAPSTHYDALNRPASRRERRDEALKSVIALEWDRRRILGARTLWLRLPSPRSRRGPLHRGTAHGGTWTRRSRPRGREATPRGHRSEGASRPGPGGPAIQPVPARPVVGRGLHACVDVGRVGSRRLRVRRREPPNPRMRGCGLDGDPARAGLARTGPTDPPP